MIRRTSHAGSFYPRFKEQIIAMINQWIAGEKVAPDSEKALALVVPHAGYIYSGACAAKGFHYISQQPFDSFIILHPSHQGIHFDYSVAPFEQYETPLGMLNQDEELLIYSQEIILILQIRLDIMKWNTQWKSNYRLLNTSFPKLRFVLL